MRESVEEKKNARILGHKFLAFSKQYFQPLNYFLQTLFLNIQLKWLTKSSGMPGITEIPHEMQEKIKFNNLPVKYTET